MAAPKIINKAEDIATIEGLSSGDQERFQKIDPTDTAGFLSFTQDIQAKRAANPNLPPIQIDIAAIQQELLQTKSLQNTTKPPASSPQPKNTRGTLSTSSTFFGSSVASLFGRELARQDNIAKGVESNHQKDIASRIKNALDRSDQEGLKTVLNELQPDALLEAQKNSLLQHLDQASPENNLELKTTISTSFETLKQKHQNEQSLWESRHPGKLAPGKIQVDKVMQQLFQERNPRKQEVLIQQLITGQQNLVHNDLYQLLVTKKPGLFKPTKSLFPKQLQKTLLSQIKESGEKINLPPEKQEEEKEEEPAQNIDINRFIREEIEPTLPEQIQETPEPITEELPEITKNPLSLIGEETEGLGQITKVGSVAAETAPEIAALTAEAPAAAAGPAAALAPVMPYILIGLAILLALILLIVIIFALIKNASISTSPQPGQSLCPQAAPSTTAQMITILEQKFNIIVHGTDTNQIADIYNTSCKLSTFSFVSLMHLPKVKIDLFIDNPACTGHTSSQTGGYRVDFHACSSAAGDEFILTHELGHVIQFENPGLVASFCSEAYGGKIVQGRCESSSPNTLPTYNCLRDYTPTFDSPNPAECFSDMVGAYLTYKNFHDTLIVNHQIVPKNWQLMNDYPNNFRSYWNFATKYIFSSNSTGSGDTSQLVNIGQAIIKNLHKTFFRSVDLFDQINNPGHFQLPNSPNPNYIIQMRGIKPPICVTINRDLQCVSSRYFCTNLLIDSYNVALGKGLLGENLGDVESMINFWKFQSNQGFIFVHYRLASEQQSALTDLSKNFSGAALFFESKEGVHNGFEHVALISDMKIDTLSGNGWITTYEANSGSTTGKYNIYHWQIKGVPYPVTGFGLYNKKK